MEEKEFLIHCPDKQSVSDARSFFRKMFDSNIVIDNEHKMVTTIGITVRFMSTIHDACGLKLDDFLTISNKHEHVMYDKLYVSTLG